MKQSLLFALLISFGLQASAQYEMRKEDFFWKRKVVNRIDLNEKINYPIIMRESQYYTDNSRFSHKSGLILALFEGLKAGTYTAFEPDSLSKPMSYEDVLAKIQEIEGSLTGESEEEFGFDDAGGGDEFGGDDFGVDDSWGFEDDGFGDDGFGDDLGGELSGPATPASTFGGADFDPGPYENILQFVEDRIFDRNRSQMMYDIRFLEIIWTDPGEALPEKKLCTFAYQDIISVLEATQWKNRYNDAEYRNLKEVFELRLFHSFIIDVSGQGVRSTEESEKLRRNLVEFEHNLWSY